MAVPQKRKMEMLFGVGAAGDQCKACGICALVKDADLVCRKHFVPILLRTLADVVAKDQPLEEEPKKTAPEEPKKPPSANE